MNQSGKILITSVLVLTLILIGCGDDKKTIIQGGGKELGNIDDGLDLEIVSGESNASIQGKGGSGKNQVVPKDSSTQGELPVFGVDPNTPSTSKEMQVENEETTSAEAVKAEEKLKDCPKCTTRVAATFSWQDRTYKYIDGKPQICPAGSVETEPISVKQLISGPKTLKLTFPYCANYVAKDRSYYDYDKVQNIIANQSADILLPAGWSLVWELRDGFLAACNQEETSCVLDLIVKLRTG